MPPLNSKDDTVLVTGATGYIGGRLIPLLLEQGYRIRCLVRDKSRLEGRPWAKDVTIVEADLLKADTLTSALQGIKQAYYLVHSMAGGPQFHESDLIAAKNFAQAAKQAHCDRIIYLGALATAAPNLSEHLRSRQETGDVLRSEGVAVTEFRAGVIVGSGSLSFEMIRYLTERVPVMICPSWVKTKTQPIGIREVLEYLVASLEVDESRNQIVEIGGSEVITYGEMMTQYAAERGLKRLMISVPVLTPRLSSYWVNIVTPIPASIARPLIEGLRNENIVKNNTAQQLFPQVIPTTYKLSVQRALAKLEASDVQTIWTDALSSSQTDTPSVMLKTEEGMIQETRQLRVKISKDKIFKVLSSLGGERGWLYMNWTWSVRGWIDRLLGGVGLRRGRRDAHEMRAGDAIDFWRVEAIEKNQLIRLRAEMKVPGKAWLQFKLVSDENNKTVISQTAFFAPMGLWGWAYWYLLYPMHSIIFSGLIKKIAKLAASEQS